MEIFKSFFPDISSNSTRKSVRGLSEIGSSLGIKYPTNRDHPLHSGDVWLEGKRADEGAEGLWRIHDELYDLTYFIRSHPGGREWIRMTKVSGKFLTLYIKIAPNPSLSSTCHNELAHQHLQEIILRQLIVERTNGLKDLHQMF